MALLLAAAASSSPSARARAKLAAGTGCPGTCLDALARGLAALRGQAAPPTGQVLAGTLAANLAGFQLAQGLKADGTPAPPPSCS